jgi:hypothetical protein
MCKIVILYISIKFNFIKKTENPFSFQRYSKSEEKQMHGHSRFKISLDSGLGRVLRVLCDHGRERVLALHPARAEEGLGLTRGQRP